MLLPRPLLLCICVALPTINALTPPGSAHKKANHRALSPEQKAALANTAGQAGMLDPMNVVQEGGAGRVGGVVGAAGFGDDEEDESALRALLIERGIIEERARTPVSVAPATSTTSTTPTATKTTSTTSTTPTSTKATTTAGGRTPLTVSATALTLPTQPAGACASLYVNTAYGAVYGPGLGTFPMSPRPSTFVYRSGNSLYLNGAAYRVVGPNIYWLGLDENVVSTGSYPDQNRVREAMAQAVAMGANTIRSHTLGISTGNALSIWPSYGNTNNAAFQSIDYAIWAARNYGLRLIIPLTDNYAYYHGGKYDFLNWAGLGTSNPGLFYTNPTVTSMFSNYISTLLNHVNQYTGVAYKNDPTIMAWETGNELGGYMLGNSGGPPTAAWTLGIAQFIKNLAPNQLVIDGSDGLVNSNGVTQNTGLGVNPVDLVTDHFYPLLDWLLTKDQGIMNSYPNKNYLVGEFDWTQQFGGDLLSNFFSIVEGFPGSGSMFWSLFGHDPQCCNWITHNDGYSMLYPNGNGGNYANQILAVTQHWHRMRGMAVPSGLPAVACPQPALLA